MFAITYNIFQRNMKTLCVVFVMIEFQMLYLKIVVIIAIVMLVLFKCLRI